MIVENVGGFKVEAIGGGIDTSEIASVEGGAGAVAQILAEHALDEGGARVLRRSTLAKRSLESVMEIFALILPLYCRDCTERKEI